MQIIHKIDDFLFTIFPEIKGKSNESIIQIFEEYYTFEGIEPKVRINEGLVEIEIDSSAIISQNTDYKKTIELCEKGEYDKAKPILHRLIEKNPSNSEYHRILGQILSDEGKYDESINCLIDALRWNSKNGWALLMMGNVFTSHKNDLTTAMKYYDQALAVNPNDFITINNIGGNLLQQEKYEEAKKYFLEVLKINPEYANSHYALGLIAEKENDLNSAFNSIIQSIKFNPKKDALYQNSLSNAFKIAQKIVGSDTGKKILKEYRYKLEFAGGTEIDIIEDNTIDTSAKFEFAENYKRKKHVVKYKPNYPAVEHLIMHELVHLDFVIVARKVELNQLFLSNQKHNDEFLKSVEPTIKNLRKKGIPEDSISKFCNGLFRGMNTQLYNVPIDLFIENFLYNEFPELRPYQFLSLFNMNQDAIKAVNDKQVLEFSPKEILSANKILNIVNSLQFKDLYGIDLTQDFQATSYEQKQAKKFYDEYLTYKDDKEPAEEYELIAHWAEDLNLNKFFELEGEIQYRKRQNLDSFMDAFEKDPLGLEDKDPVKEREMKKFLEGQKIIGTNMAVVMHMVSALEFFEGMKKEEIHKIALDIAMQGTMGFNPEKKDYRISSITGKVFSGYHILAYYYVSWALAIPEMLAQLQLPYEKEYEMAVSMYKP